MKKIIILIISLIMLDSCSSQNSIDLLELPLPLKIEKLFNEKYIFKVDKKFPDLADFYGARSFDSNLMYVSGEAISNSEKYPIELITFVDLKTDEIGGYNLKMNTTKAANQLEKLLRAKYNTPNYYGSNSAQSTSIWTDTINNTIVYLQHYYPRDKTKEHGSKFYVFHLDFSSIIESSHPPTMAYYLDYLNFINKENLNLTYKEFADIMVKDYFNDTYLKAISNPYKH